MSDRREVELMIRAEVLPLERRIEDLEHRIEDLERALDRRDAE